MKNKSRLRMEIKDISEQGSFEGLLSPYGGNPDDYGDIIEPGAYTKTLKEHGSTVPLLWQHKSDCPIGQLQLEDRQDGLYCKGSLVMDLPEAQKAYTLIKRGIVKGLSIGFLSVKDAIDGGIRKLKEIRLYEGSIVTFPANEMALISSIKRAQKQNGGQEQDGPGDFNDELQEVYLRAGHYMLLSALENSLDEIRSSDLSKDDMVTAAQTTIQQFSDAYLTFLPSYLDMLAELYGGWETYSRSVRERKAAAKTKTVEGTELAADCFAYVGDPEDTSTWKLPIKFPGDEEKTKAHIRNALARFGQTTGIPESERPKVLAKIVAAAKKYGIDVSEDQGKALVLSLKQGARHSSETKDSIRAACMAIKGAHDDLLALIGGEAGDDEGTSMGDGGNEAPDDSSQAVTTTSSAKAAEQSEPEFHSAFAILDDIRALIPGR